jgi:hypothetical protein
MTGVEPAGTSSVTKVCPVARPPVTVNRPDTGDVESIAVDIPNNVREVTIIADQA